MAVIRQQVMFSDDGSSALRPLCGNVKNLERKYGVNGYISQSSVAHQGKVMRNKSEGTFCKDGVALDGKAFVGNVHILSDKTRANLNTTAIVAHPVHAVLMKFTCSIREWFTGNVHTAGKYLVVKHAVQNEAERVLSEVKASTRYLSIGYKEIQMKERCRVQIMTTSRYLHTRLMPAVFETLFVTFK